MDTPPTVPRVPFGCSCLKYLKAHKFAELLRVAVPCITWLSKTYWKGRVPGNSSQILSATKSSTYLFLVGVDCLVNVPLTILIPDDQYPHLV